MKLRVLDLFSGIGGISLGLERTGGFETAAFCEIDKAAQKVLNKHWPSVPIYEDVSTLSPKDIDGTIDVICGGFPCQDISNAGKGAGLAGARSGLWYEFHRLIKEIKPKFAIIENVAALRSKGLDSVLWSLAEIGYDAEWHCIPAAALGAPHQRDRIWIIAYPNSNLVGCNSGGDHRQGRQVCSNEERNHPTPLPDGEQQEFDSGPLGKVLAHTCCSGLSGGKQLRNHLEEVIRGWEATSRPASKRCSVSGGTIYSWDTEPSLGRVADGVPGRVDRIKQLGNAVVPQIPELIGKAILRTYE